MPSARSARLAACLLLLLLIGWAVRWWRNQISAEAMEVPDVPGLEDREILSAKEAPEIDQPPD